ncbi:MAG: hypothetical protein EOP38_12125 [Rubrivivax sp.]|nr:MAG: hypothetical protein EOP38_12125 [Rubrivivax sp.]
MKLFNLFSSAGEKEFAKELVKQLTREISPTLMEKRKALSVNKITRLLERTYQMATAYQKDHRLGVIKRAVLANSFKWELKSNGYPDEFVDMATEGLVVTLSKVDKTQT